MLLDAVRFERTRFSEAPQIKWGFMLDFGNATLEYDLWTPVEFTADSRISGFIGAVTDNPYPEEPGVYCVKDFIQKAAPAVWGLRKNPQGEKETILRFYPSPVRSDPSPSITPREKLPEEKPKQKVLGPSYIQPKSVAPNPSILGAEEVPSKEIIHYSLRKEDKGFFYNLMEVPVEFDINDRLRAELDKTTLLYEIPKDHIIIQMHSRGLNMLQEDLKDKFHFIPVKRE